jgi:hypothetical protein
MLAFKASKMKAEYKALLAGLHTALFVGAGSYYIEVYNDYNFVVKFQRKIQRAG